VDPALAPSEPLSLYVHIPFCLKKCPYCDFNSYAPPGPLPGPVGRGRPTYPAARVAEASPPVPPDYLGALVSELDRTTATLNLRGRRLCTIYLGGGTPSLLSAGQVAALLEGIRRQLPLAPDCEVTIEANPGTVDEAALRGYAAAGINRLSLGVQSFDDAVLEFLGRIHTAQESREAFALARQAGLANVSIDLIWAVPGQTLDAWRQTLREACALAPDHISAYCLTYEEGTPLFDRRARGEFEAADEDLELAMLRDSVDALTGAGYWRYEISNFARPGFQCRHNIAYWTGADYLGIGAGAHSHLQGTRWWNVRDPAEYVSRLTRGVSALDGSERLGMRRRAGEAILTGLRLTSGISLDDVDRRTGGDSRALFAKELAELTGLGLLQLADGIARLTPRGLELADEVGLRFVEDACMDNTRHMCYTHK
jgi:oxygen-independent coproporphyrinogen-3 oxidase